MQLGGGVDHKDEEDCDTGTEDLPGVLWEGPPTSSPELEGRENEIPGDQRETLT